jgi:hypothetical protein
LAVATGRGDASPSPTTIRSVGGAENGNRFAFRLTTPQVTILEGASSGAEVRIDGFLSQERRPGAPDLPTRIVRVAIPPGVVPRLEIIPGREDLRRGVRPRAVPTIGHDLFDEAELERADDPAAAVSQLGPRRATRHEIRAEAPEWYTGSTPVPAKVAWLGEIGVLRDQRYVEVYLAPVRFDPRIGGLRVASDFQVIVHFDGDTLERSAPVEDPRFESVYRNAFVNYAEGTTFRLSAFASESQAPAPAMQSALATGPIRRIKANDKVQADHGRVALQRGPLVYCAEWPDIGGIARA